MDFLSFVIETMLTESLKYMQSEKGTRKKWMTRKLSKNSVFTFKLCAKDTYISSGIKERKGNFLHKE